MWSKSTSSHRYGADESALVVLACLILTLDIVGADGHEVLHTGGNNRCIHARGQALQQNISSRKQNFRTHGALVVGMGVEHEHLLVRALPRRELIAHERVIQIQALALFAARVVDAVARAQRIDRTTHLVGAYGRLGIQV